MPGVSVRESPWRFVATFGGVGVLAWALTVFFIFTYPQLVLPEGAQPAYFDVWIDPVARVGNSIVTYGVPLLVAVGGYYSVRTNRATVENVLVWSAIGTVAVAVLLAGIGWLVTDPRVRLSTVEYAGRAGLHVGQIVGAAIIGALGANVVDARRSGGVE